MFRGRFRCQLILDSWLPVHDPWDRVLVTGGLQMIRAKYDSRNSGWFAQFYGCFAQGSCYVVCLSN